MLLKRLLRLKHDRTDMGFLSAHVSEEEPGRQPFWSLRVESPSSTGPFRDHLSDGSSMTFSMITRDGSHMHGEAYVSSISEGVDAATIVVLAGSGPLKKT